MDPIDPVSGNPIPPGASANEVRDDIPANLSENEFVIPANVVRFYGLKFFNNLMNKAKEELGDTPSDDLPFSPEELESDAGPVQMAGGGFVQSGGGFNVGAPTNQEEPDEIVPLFRKPRVINSAPDGEGSEPHQGPTGLAGSVDQWSVDNFTNYAENRGSLVNRGIQSFISSVVPFGGQAIKARYNYLDKEVPTKLDQMIESGKDQKGTALTPEQISNLQAARAKLAEDEDFRPGVQGLVREGMQSLFGRRERPEEATAPTTTETKPAVSKQRPSNGGVDDNSDDVKSSSDYSSKASTSSTSGSNKSGSGSKR